MNPTTESRLASLSARTRRDKHPARSARILTAGLSVASVLGIASLLRLGTVATASQSGSNTANQPHSDSPARQPSPVISGPLENLTSSISPIWPAVPSNKARTSDRIILEVPQSAAPSARTSGSK